MSTNRERKNTPVGTPAPRPNLKNLKNFSLKVDTQRNL